MSTAAPPKQSAAEEQLARLRQRSDVARQEAGGSQSSPDAKGGQPDITAEVSPKGDRQPKDLTKAEAQKEVTEIKKDMSNLRTRLKELHDRNGHKALGYKSWRHFCFVEFNLQKSHAYRLIRAADLEEILKVGEYTHLNFTDPQLRALDNADDPQEAWDKAVNQFGMGKHHHGPTAAQIKEVTTGKPAEKPTPVRKAKTLTVQVYPASIPADGKTEAVVTAILNDTRGVGLSGRTVTFRAGNQLVEQKLRPTQFGPVTDNGNGIYQTTVTSRDADAARAGRVSIEAQAGHPASSVDEETVRGRIASSVSLGLTAPVAPKDKTPETPPVTPQEPAGQPPVSGPKDDTTRTQDEHTEADGPEQDERNAWKEQWDEAREQSNWEHLVNLFGDMTFDDIPNLFVRDRTVKEEFVSFTVKVPPEIAAMLEKLYCAKYPKQARNYTRATMTRLALCTWLMDNWPEQEDMGDVIEGHETVERVKLAETTDGTTALDVIKQVNGTGITAKTLADKLAISIDTAERWLQRLMDDAQVTRAQVDGEYLYSAVSTTAG